MSTVWVLTDARYRRQRMPLALIDRLIGLGIPTRSLVAEELIVGMGSGPTDADPWRDLSPGDVVLARTRNPFGLALLRGARRPGVRVLTPWESVAIVRNKARAMQVLHQLGIDVPPTFLADAPANLEGLPAACFPLVLKPHLGDNARGIAVVRDASELDDLIWDDGMVLAQTFVDTGGIDTKVYVAGERIWAVRRPSPLNVPGLPWAGTGGRPALREVFDPDPGLRRVAELCGSAFGLRLYGIDVLEAGDRSVVVDVNDYPNYTGIAEAPRAIAAMAIHELREPVPA